MGTVSNPRDVWNGRFSRIRARTGGQASAHYEPWLDRWDAALARAGTTPILDLGCGSGGDSCYLAARGLPVLAADITRQALSLTRGTAACAALLELDVRGGLPFRTAALPVIVANLSLHYHRWADTCIIFRDVRRCLQPGGFLLVRLNSTQDTLHGARGNPPVERNCYSVGHVLKRFFDRADIDALFDDGWTVHSVEEQVVHCYDNPKALWEVVAEKPPAP